mgnify:CR=1 FL=1
MVWELTCRLPFAAVAFIRADMLDVQPSPAQQHAARSSKDDPFEWDHSDTSQTDFDRLRCVCKQALGCRKKGKERGREAGRERVCERECVWVGEVRKGKGKEQGAC